MIAYLLQTQDNQGAQNLQSGLMCRPACCPLLPGYLLDSKAMAEVGL